MKCWLAMHYPHYPVDEAEWFVYVRRGDEAKVASFASADRVAFYEVGKGPDRLGKERRRPAGRSAIVCLATGSGHARPATFQEAYVGGDLTDYVQECPCTNHVHQHLLRRDEMFDALGRKLNLRGLGGGAGFIEISPEEFTSVEAAFLSSSAD